MNGDLLLTCMSWSAGLMKIAQLVGSWIAAGAAVYCAWRWWEVPTFAQQFEALEAERREGKPWVL